MFLADDLIEGAGAESGCEGRLALEAAVGGVGEEAQRATLVGAGSAGLGGMAVGGVGGAAVGGTDDPDTQWPGQRPAAAWGRRSEVGPDWVFGYTMTSRMFSSPANRYEPVDPDREPGVRGRP